MTHLQFNISHEESEVWCHQNFDWFYEVGGNCSRKLKEVDCTKCLIAAMDFGDDCFDRMCEIEKVWDKPEEATEEWK